jgi:putative Ca2+/H+ antiporter (TMEM165/GDT1 family)
MKTYGVVFLTVFLAELGDKTQLATLLFATDSAASRLGVFVAAAGALVISTLLAVTIGARVGAWLAPQMLRLAAGVGFLAIGCWILLVRS